MSESPWWALVWGPLLAAFFGIAVMQLLAWRYGYRRARATGQSIWQAIGEGAAVAVGNSYVVHVCKEERAA